MSYIKNELYKKSLGLKITIFLLVVSILFWMIPSNMIFGSEEGGEEDGGTIIDESSGDSGSGGGGIDDKDGDETGITPDIVSPVITLIGANPVEIKKGSTYMDAGATAEDDVDGDITSSIVAIIGVDNSTAGEYIVTYNVSDSAGNAAEEVTRTVNVVEPVVIDKLGASGGLTLMGSSPGVSVSGSDDIVPDDPCNGGSLYNGNYNVGNLPSGLTGFKIECDKLLINGEYPVGSPVIRITDIKYKDDEDGGEPYSITWELIDTSVKVYIVAMKGGSNTNLYNYSSGSTGATNCTLINPENKKHYEISHIVFGYKKIECIPKADVKFNKDFKETNTGGSNLSSPAKFNIYDASDTGFTSPLRPAVQLSNDGEVKFEDLDPGSYIIVENPAGVHSDGTPYSPMPNIKFTVNDDGTVTFTAPSGFKNGDTVENYKVAIATYKISGYKYDSKGTTSTEDDTGLSGWTINLKDENGQIIATTTTSDGGYYEFTGLLPGNYTVEEVMKDGWTNDTPVSISVTLASSDSNNNNFRNHNIPTGKVKVYKKVINVKNDKQAFSVKLFVNDNNNIFDPTNPGSNGWEEVPDGAKSFTELNNGYAEWTVEKCKYYVALEVNIPDDYIFVSASNPVRSECDVTLTIKNKYCPEGSITVTKSGLEGSDQARLYLWNTNGTPGTGDDTLINTATAPSPQTVSNGGTATWNGLPYGNYYIKEDFNGITTNVYTYAVSNPVANVTVDGNESLTIENTPKKGSLTVTKRGLEGSDKAKLYLWNTNGTPGTSDDTLINTATAPSPQTVSNGDTATWTGLPYGDYYIKEDFNGITTNVYTYTVSSPVANVTVDGNEYIKVNNHAEKYSVTVHKSGLEWGSKFTWPFYWADKAVFTLTGPAGPYSEVRTATLDNIPVVGDPSFIVWKGLPAGEYVLTESYPGTNHFTYTSSITLPLTFNLGPSQAFNIINYPEKGSLTVTKTGLEGSDRANLSLYDSNDNLINTATAPSPQTVSNDDTATWTGLPYGDYYIVEDFDSINNTYTYDFDNPIWSGEIEGDVGAEVPVVLENCAEKGSIEILKTDKTTGLPVGGSTFELLLYKEDSWTLMDTQKLGEDGRYKWENLPYGLYKLVEKEASQGYLLFGDPAEIEITLDSETPDVVLEKEIADPRIPGEITLNKSGLGSASVAGFTLYDSDGNAVGGEKRITGNGTVRWSNLQFDTYKIVETTIPSGYSKMADITGIVVNSTHRNYSFDRVNIKKTITTTTTTPGVIQVLGIQELPFTGMNPAIPVTGVSSILAGGLMVILSFVRRKYRRK